MLAAALQAAWRALPLGTLADIAGPATCLVLAPHPDDESLGCGGLIAAACQAGRPPLVAILTDGAGSHAGSRAWPPERLRAQRAQEVRAATAALGLPPDRLLLLDQPDAHAPLPGDAGFAPLVSRLAGIATAFGCDRILTTWEHDPHCDHQAAWHLAATVARQAGLRRIAYPVWGWMLQGEVAAVPSAGVRLDIAPVLALKRQAIAAHRSQHGTLIRDDPNAFALPAELLAICTAPFETFLLP
jgi:LmbE family N-acetylglucosaminyl deacetylase